MHPIARALDPRRSLASAIAWLAFLLSISLTVVANIWVADIVRSNLLEQRGRQLARTADRVAAKLNLNLALRSQKIRVLAATLASELGTEQQASLPSILDGVRRASPEFDWIAITDRRGKLLASTDAAAAMTIGAIPGSGFADGDSTPSTELRLSPSPRRQAASASNSGPFVDMYTPVIDIKGGLVGGISTQLGTRWLKDLAASLRQELGDADGTESLLVGADATVLIGPSALQGRPWQSTPESVEGLLADDFANGSQSAGDAVAHVERLADAQPYLVADAKPGATESFHALGWRVVAVQPLPQATRRARALQHQITAILLGLGMLAASVGMLLARRLTRDLEAIAHSADAVRTGVSQQIIVPSGRNEAARLGRTLDDLLTSLHHERAKLQTLNAELDQRVAARTREIERMADQARYDALVRERLKIARELHDTLAHSMMAMLTEIRLLRRVSQTNPAALQDELNRAEETAHQGLREARAAIGQMRFNPVRDAGLAAALSDLVKLFVDRTGIQAEFNSSASSSAFADRRAEIMFRIAQEALRNIERHSGASQAAVALMGSGNDHEVAMTITDDGIGFNPDAPCPGHYGIAGLHEQAQLIGATLTILSAPQAGTRITVSLPRSRED